MKVANPPSLQEVNDHLLTRLDVLIADANPEELLDITEALAKFNSSIRNNDQFYKPESSEERARREANGVLSELLGNSKPNNGEVQEGEIV